jgi:hypothetical protein
MNTAGYQEDMPVVHHMVKEPVKAKETCMLCKDFVPFGCEKCRSELAACEADYKASMRHDGGKKHQTVVKDIYEQMDEAAKFIQKICVGSGEDMMPGVLV